MRKMDQKSNIVMMIVWRRVIPNTLIIAIDDLIFKVIVILAVAMMMSERMRVMMRIILVYWLS